MNDLFGGDLTIRDAFTSTFSKFNSAISKSTSSFNMFTQKIGESERTNRQATNNMKNQITQLAQTYVNQGYTMSQAIKKATSEIEKQAPSSGSKWADAFGKIKQSGVDAFGNISSKIQSFSNSTIGMISKITLGFASLKTVMVGFKTGFGTAMQYQDSRVTLNTLYGDKEKGGEQFKIANDFANTTPWDNEQTTKSMVKLKAYGLDDSLDMMQQMSDLGATFKSSGKDMNMAVEAYADMMNGEWERMVEFGIKRKTMEATGEKMGLTFDNKQGQITNKENLAKIFTQYMKDKNYTGVTEELEKTGSGKMSTMFGNLKKSLAELVGIADDGSVKSGSLFEKFIDGMQNFISKINEFSKSESFDKISNTLGDIGGAILNGFSYLMDHPEIAGGLIKLGVGLWTLGKISSVIGMFSSVIGAFGSGGILAALAPIAPYVFAIAGGFLALKSIISPDGMLHQGISWLLSKIPFIGSDLQQYFEVGTKVIKDFFGDIWDWIKSQFGFETTKKTDDPFLGEDTSKWYAGKYAKATDSDLTYKTASNALKDGTITKTDSSRIVTNKTDVHVNIDTVRETADVDEIGDAIAKRLEKHAQTRNNLE